MIVPYGKTLYPFQPEAIQFALDREHSMIADPPGAGKTIDLAIFLNSIGYINNVLIVTTASMKRKFARELREWLVVDYPVAVADDAELPDAPIVITNWDRLAKQHKSIRARKWDVLGLDEYHKLSNPTSGRSKQIYGSKDFPELRGRRTVALTGTPVFNRPFGLRPLVSYLDPRGFGKMSEWSFNMRYCGPTKKIIGWDRLQRKAKTAWEFNGISHVPELREKLSNIMIYREKREIMKFLPPLQRRLIPLKLPRKLRNKEWLSTRGESASILSITKANLADMESGRVDTAQRRLEGIEKIPFIIDHLEDAIEESGKVVCFSYHRDVMDAIEKHFGSRSVTLHGGTSSRARDRAVERFQTDPACVLFNGQIQAASEGITLVASSRTVIAEPSSLSEENKQCEGRTERIGQTADNLLVDYLCFEGSADALRISDMIDKSRMINRILV